eukprot:m.237745 g.237745  ORF g.237745 m.237745 type:complete len:484 (+) comp17113_c1_seq8:62-1513(+)
MSWRTAFLLVTLLLISPEIEGRVMYNSGMRTIGTSIKGGMMTAGNETVLFEHYGQGVITEQWYTGMGVMDENCRIRIYVDGEDAHNVSLDFNLFFAHAIGTNSADEQPNTPWATPRIAHTADGSIYNTIRIPFEKSIRITATPASTGNYWYIVRGVENYPLMLGDLQLPTTAKLKLYKLVDYPTQPLDFVTLANVSSDTAGALFLVTCQGVSPDYNYLEACFRAYLDGQETPQFLSSGTEDFFLSSYYFKSGLYHEENSGCTAKLDSYSPPAPPPTGPTDYQNYFLGTQNATCTQACSQLGRVCDPNMYLGPNNGQDMIKYLNITCDFDSQPWWAPDQPNYVSGKVQPGGEPEPNYNKCLGFIGYPIVSNCDGQFPTVRRVCHCRIPGPPPPPPPTYTMVTAYKFFENDPVLFNTGLKLVWRNMEQGGDDPTGCPNQWPPNTQLSRLGDIERNLQEQRARLDAPMVAAANYTAYTWVYEWPSQ